MSSKNDTPDFTGQWLCCRQEDMDKLIAAGSSGVKGFLTKNAAWATGYGVGKTTMNIDQDGDKFTIVMNGLSGGRTNEFEVNVTKEMEDSRVEGKVPVSINWIDIDNTKGLKVMSTGGGRDLIDIRYINDNGELVQIQETQGVKATRWFEKKSKK